MFLKRLFYASLTLLVFTLIFHLGARNAQGQFGPTWFLGTHGTYPFVVLTDGSAFIASSNTSPAPWVPLLDVPVKANPHPEYGTSIIGAGDRCVITDTGRVFVLNSYGGWYDVGNAPVGVTPAVGVSWGALKEKGR